MNGKEEYRTAGETAKLLGVTMKTLKVYEDRGLIMPQRTEAGWRLYGPEEVETLTKILALKSAGFSLSDVKTLLDGRLTVKDALEKQSHMLRRQAHAIEMAIAIIAEAEKALTAEGGFVYRDAHSRGQGKRGA